MARSPEIRQRSLAKVWHLRILHAAYGYLENLLLHDDTLTIEEGGGGMPPAE
jgi:hypothetical protein